jgi:serine/threonine protein kinase
MLHNIGIVHRDIKVQNILWSRRLHRFVLCDFGLSTSITERLGQKTLTEFCGTWGCMSKQMEKLKKSPHKGLVDLFYNDIYGLNRVINFIQGISFKRNPVNNFTSEVSYSSNIVINSEKVASIQKSLSYKASSFNQSIYAEQ